MHPKEEGGSSLLNEVERLLEGHYHKAQAFCPLMTLFIREQQTCFIRPAATSITCLMNFFYQCLFHVFVSFTTLWYYTHCTIKLSVGFGIIPHYGFKFYFLNFGVIDQCCHSCYKLILQRGQ